jgi:hypothetical protein
MPFFTHVQIWNIETCQCSFKRENNGENKPNGNIVSINGNVTMKFPVQLLYTNKNIKK